MKAILFVLLILIGLFKRKGNFYNYLVIFFLGYLVYTAEDLADFENYKISYDYICSGHFYSDLGIGWYYLCKIGALIGLEYKGFKTMVTLVSLLLINNTLNYFLKESKKKYLVWTFYLVFPALLDCVQVRFLIAEAIVLFGIRYLFRSKSIDMIKYILIILLASTLHSAMLLYLSFCLYKLLGKNKIRYIIIVFLISSFLLLFKDIVINICSTFINSLRVQRYFYSEDSLGIKGIISYILILGFSYYTSNSMLKKAKEMNLSEEHINFFDMLEKLNLVIMITFAFSVFDPNFFRLQRIMWILMFIGGVILFENNINNIGIFRIKFSVKSALLFLTIIGNLLLITINTFSVVEGLLF